MKPEQYEREILPKIEEMWEKECFCKNDKFLKLVGFNFQDYGYSPAALADAEILIDKLIRKNFQSLSIETNSSITIQTWHCPQCGSICREYFSEYSINMMRSYIEYEKAKPADDVYYLIGYYGFDVGEDSKYEGFEKTGSVEIYLSQFKK